ncbi:S-adenosyl methyltransferase [Pseudonocardia hierapolitana]|uniref:S-adenosyl methyltransferase n=1 Tax=Pseudonocardia hierapolitana TaxID=1128676 RepID=A0A561SH77_9PSEU|nr:SAM-dependent methyltransferase [Pseudonocardia hierapolitana]TWF74218.1 S-adenosyl methyltransferase [Pseudonocardia hierapolitana]
MTDQPLPDIRPDVPHGARIWNYWLGGKDNYAADREIGDAVSSVFPEIVDMAFKSRQFLIRAVRHLAGEAGIRQFLDVGTGLPTMQNTHEVAQSVAPEAKIVYVDNDPLVLAHARALLVNTTPEGVTQYIDADYHQPDRIIEQAREILDFSRPIAVMFMGVFGYVPDYDEARSIISRVIDTTPSGSYLALWDGTSTSEAVVRGARAQAELGSPYQLRTVEEIRGWFAGTEPIEPGIVPLTQWRPENVEVGRTEHIDAYCGVGRKP